MVKIRSAAPRRATVRPPSEFCRLLRKAPAARPVIATSAREVSVQGQLQVAEHEGKGRVAEGNQFLIGGVRNECCRGRKKAGLLAPGRQQTTHTLFDRLLRPGLWNILKGNSSQRMLLKVGRPEPSVDYNLASGFGNTSAANRQRRRSPSGFISAVVEMNPEAASRTRKTRRRRHVERFLT